ncbi:MAG: hypothetical protein ABJD07_02800 [Gemmatimonadaceae bacterium]
MTERETTPYESAQLILELYELRRDPELRSARDWFVNRFHPTSADDVLARWMGPESAGYRMVTSYWEMAASLVVHGAIDDAMFRDANSEYIAVIAKLAPFLAELRATTRQPHYLQHLESIVTRMPDSATRLENMRRYMKMKRDAAAAVSASPAGA